MFRKIILFFNKFRKINFINKIDYSIILFLLEESREEFIDSVISTMLFLKYNIRVDTVELESLKDSPLSQDVLDKITELQPELDEFLSHIIINDSINNITYSGGSIVVSDKANPLFSTPEQETGNTIKTGVGEVGRYYAIQNNSDGTNFALLDNPLTHLSDPTWIGTTNLVNENLNSNLVNYDAVRLHLRTGFSFSGRGYEGFLFQVRAKRYSGIYNYFTSLAYLNYSNFEIQNPKPFVISGVGYSKFIEIKVPSLVDMYDNTLNLDFQDAFFGTGQDAVNPTSNYEIVFKLIDKVTELNNVKYIDCSEATFPKQIFVGQHIYRFR